MLLIILFVFNLEFSFPYSFEDLDIDDVEMQHYTERKLELPAIDALSGEIYMPYLFNTGVGNREKLHLNDVSVEETFPYGHGVISWSEIQFGGRQYLVGRQNNSVTLVQVKIKHKEKFNILKFHHSSLSFEGSIGPIVLTKHFNDSSGFEEGFALVTESTEDNFQSIHWLKITNGLVAYNTWSNPTRGEIIDLKWIKFDFTEYLIITTRDYFNVTTIDLSEYKLQDNKMRLLCLDKVKIYDSVNSLSAVIQGEDLYLALAKPSQNNFSLFRRHFNMYKEDGFEHLFDIPSPGLTVVSSFVQAGRKYFITNGLGPNIYLLNQNGTLSSQLSNTGQIEEWLVLKVPNYRQDVILLARGPTGISVLTWSGSIKGFTVSQQPPCFLFDSAKNNYNLISEDVACLAACKWSKGVPLNLGHFPALLLTCNSGNDAHFVHRLGGLYHFNVSLHPVHGPAEDIIHVLKKSKLLEDELEKLSRDFEENGLLDDINLSRGRLQQEWNGQINSLEDCLKNLEDQICQLSSYMDLKRQNDVLANITLHQGKLSGSASGFLANQPVSMTFNGKVRHHSGNSLQTLDRAMIIDTDITIDGTQQFVVEAKIKLDTLKVIDVAAMEKKLSSGFGVSPEIQGPPLNYKNSELPIHEKIFMDMYN